MRIFLSKIFICTIISLTELLINMGTDNLLWMNQLLLINHPPTVWVLSIKELREVFKNKTVKPILFHET